MSGRSNTLECAVCLGQFDLGQHVPKSLRCMHTFCESCVDNLPGGTTLSCPTCRRDCARSDVGTNFALTDILESLCRICGDREKAAKCHHCDKEVCAVCLESHAGLYKKEVHGLFASLKQIMTDSVGLSMDSAVIAAEQDTEERVLTDIKETVDQRRELLDEMEKALEKKVKSVKEDNVERQTRWMQSLDESTSKIKTFVRASEGDVRGDRTRVSMESLRATHDTCKSLMAELQQLRTNPPLMTRYEFRRVDDPTTPPIGDIAVHTQGSVIPQGTSVAGAVSSLVVKSLPVPSTPSPVASFQPSFESATRKYRHMKYKASTGSKGCSNDEFDGPCRITCNSDQLFVTDGRNHRVKVYSLGLQYRYSIGSKGSHRDGLVLPVGVAINQSTLNVADFGNDRVKVVTFGGSCIRTIQKDVGLPGGVKFGKPLGIAFGPDGQMYVCDGENNRVLVLKPDGSFDRVFGRFENSIQDIAVTSDKVVVKEKSCKELHVFSLTGQPEDVWPKGLPEELKNALPNCLCTDREGNVIVSYNSGCLAVLDREGRYLWSIAERGTQPGYLRGPTGVAVSNNGDIFICDCENNRIQKFGI